MQRLLVAIVDGRDAAHGEQDGRPQGSQLTADHAGYARDVMVAYEGERHEGPHEAVVSLEAPVELKEVAILEQTAFHNSYCVTASIPDCRTIRA